MPRALVAVSGGVDSSVALLLMREAGYQCQAVTLRLLDTIVSPEQDEATRLAARTSQTVQTAQAAPTAAQTAVNTQDSQIAAALQVCQHLGVSHTTLDWSERFANRVVEPFVSGYLRGETPNPCIDCNREIKFAALLDVAHREGYDVLVTGHYARIAHDPLSGTYRLLKALDADKDQSYVLYQLGQAELACLSFPLGGLTKRQVREIACQAGLATAEQPESQDICFVGAGHYRDFIHRYIQHQRQPAAIADGADDLAAFQSGEIVDTNGLVVGYHQGTSDFTIGQRRRLGIAVGHPLYVTHIDAAARQITVGEEQELYRSKALLHGFSSPLPGRLAPVMEVQAKYRYRTAEQPARLVMFDDGRWEVQFDAPQKALTPGQAMVCYQGDQVVAGGVIAEVR